MTPLPLTPDRPVTAYLLKLPPALLAAARLAALSDGRTLASWMREAIRERATTPAK